MIFNHSSYGGDSPPYTSFFVARTQNVIPYNVVLYLVERYAPKGR